jgi:hypothetical protein
LGILGKKFDWAGDDSLILPKKKYKNTEDWMIFMWFNMQPNFVSENRIICNRHGKSKVLQTINKYKWYFINIS